MVCWSIYLLWKASYAILSLNRLRTTCSSVTQHWWPCREPAGTSLCKGSHLQVQLKVSCHLHNEQCCVNVADVIAITLYTLNGELLISNIHVQCHVHLHHVYDISDWKVLQLFIHVQASLSILRVLHWPCLTLWSWCISSPYWNKGVLVDSREHM